MGRISCNERAMCIYTHTSIECIIFSLRVAMDLAYGSCNDEISLLYMFPLKFKNMQQQPLPIYFEVEFDLNDNFFSFAIQRIKKEKKLRACHNICSCICDSYAPHTFIQKKRTYTFHIIFGLISNNR